MKTILKIKCLLLCVFALCTCEYESYELTNNVAEENTKNASLLKSGEEPKTIVLWRTKIERRKGQPTSIKYRVGSDDLNHFNDSYVLHIQNGDGSKNKVSSATIKVDGEIVFDTSDFNQEITYLDKEILNFNVNTILTVEVNGKPGSYLKLKITAQLDEGKVIESVYQELIQKGIIQVENLGLFNEDIQKVEEKINVEKISTYNSIKNTTTTTIHITPRGQLGSDLFLIEFCPKQIVESVDDINFITEPTEIINADPIIMWHIPSNMDEYDVEYEVNGNHEITGSTIVIFSSLNKLIDIEGNKYYIKKIGSQWWMQENLRTSKYNDGTDIPYIDDNNVWINTTSPAYCLYNNGEGYSFDRNLYNWYTIETNKLCPDGWHVPTDDEWKELEMFLGMDENEADKIRWRGTVEGDRLKLNSGWYHPITGQPYNTDLGDSDFCALPSGGSYIHVLEHYQGLGNTGYWWSCSSNGTNYAYYRCLLSTSSRVFRGSRSKKTGMAVRCIKD